MKINKLYTKEEWLDQPLSIRNDDLDNPFILQGYLGAPSSTWEWEKVEFRTSTDRTVR